MKKAYFRLTRYPLASIGPRFIATAWNYDEAVLLATADHDTYTQAREALQDLANAASVELAWFDGEYTFDMVDHTISPLFH